jgi:hypothetical protein
MSGPQLLDLDAIAKDVAGLQREFQIAARDELGIETVVVDGQTLK